MYGNKCLYLVNAPLYWYTVNNV